MCSWVVHNILTPPPTAIGEPQAALFFGASALMHGHIHTIDTLSYLLGSRERHCHFGRKRQNGSNDSKITV